jgi:hypothetical protein
VTCVHLTRPPQALRRRGVRLENIALVPASLLPYRRQYQALANTLPHGTVLLVFSRRQAKQRQLLVRLASGFAAHGHQIATRTAEEVRRA